VGRGPAAEALVMRLMRLDHHVVFFGRQSTKFKSVLGGRPAHWISGACISRFCCSVV
jgi:hypothetical protein